MDFVKVIIFIVNGWKFIFEWLFINGVIEILVCFMIGIEEFFDYVV